MWAGDSSKAGQSSRSTEPPSPHCVRDRGVYRCRVPSARFANRGTDSSGCRSASGAPAGHTLDLSSGQTRERPTRPSKVFAPPGATDCRQRSTPVGRFTPLLFPSAMRGWRRRDCATFDSVDRCISTFIATSCSVLKGAIGASCGREQIAFCHAHLDGPSAFARSRGDRIRRSMHVDAWPMLAVHWILLSSVRRPARAPEARRTLDAVRSRGW
jgi:hypothetical protein